MKTQVTVIHTDVGAHSLSNLSRSQLSLTLVTFLQSNISALTPNFDLRVGVAERLDRTNLLPGRQGKRMSN